MDAYQLQRFLSNKCLYVNNFYSSPYLFLYFKPRELYVTGTVNPNHAGYPGEFAAEARGLSQGQFRWRQFHELVATVWEDTQAVNILSLVHPSKESVQVACNRRRGRSNSSPADPPRMSQGCIQYQWRSQGRVPGVPEPPLRDIAIAKSREKILLEPPFNSARLEK